MTGVIKIDPSDVLPTGFSQGIAWSPDGKHLLGGMHGWHLCLWDALRASGSGGLNLHTSNRLDISGVRSLLKDSGDPQIGSYSALVQLSWSPDGKRFLVDDGIRARENRIDVWRMGDGRNERPVRIGSLEKTTHRATQMGLRPGMQRVSWSPDGKMIYGCESLCQTNVWDVASLRIVDFVPNDPSRYAILCSPDNKQIACCEYDRTICFIDSTMRGSVVSIRESTKVGGGFNHLAWSPDGKRLAGACNAGMVMIWSAESYSQIAVLPAEPSFRSIAWSPDGTRLAVGGTRGIVSVFDTDCYQLLFTIDPELPVYYAGVAPHFSLVRSICWSPDSTQLALCNDDSAIRICRVPNSVAARSPGSPVIKQTAAAIAKDVINERIPTGVLADFLEDNDCDLTGHQVQQLRWGNLSPAGYWATAYD